MKNPTTCGESIKLGDVYICRLECSPCPLQFGKECAEEKMDRALKAIKTSMMANRGNSDEPR